MDPQHCCIFIQHSTNIILFYSFSIFNSLSWLFLDKQQIIKFVSRNSWSHSFLNRWAAIGHIWLKVHKRMQRWFYHCAYSTAEIGFCLQIFVNIFHINTASLQNIAVLQYVQNKRKIIKFYDVWKMKCMKGRMRENRLRVKVYACAWISPTGVSSLVSYDSLLFFWFEDAYCVAKKIQIFDWFRFSSFWCVAFLRILFKDMWWRQ